MIVVGEYPAEYAHLVRDALLRAMPWMATHIKEQPAPGDHETELRVEIPSENELIPQPYIIVTHHQADGTLAPTTDVIWWEGWGQDHVLTEFDPVAHRSHIAHLVKMFLNEESAAYNSWFEGRLTSGGTLVPPDAEPLPVGRADTIRIRSWRGTFDQDLAGDWPGWPNDPADPFYKTL